MNEREVKERKNEREYICSLTGRPCKCAIGKGCGRGMVDSLANEAVRYARTAAMRLDNAIDTLGFAIETLERERAFPAPEWRDIGRQLERTLEQLQRTIK